MPKTASRLVAIARGFLGDHETPDGSNVCHPICDVFGWCGVAWCAETLWVWLTLLGFKVAKNAGSHELISMLGKLPGWKFVPVAQARMGDLLDYTWRHVGLCEARVSPKGVSAFEGNHNNRVARVPRANSSIARVLRPPFDPEVAKPAGRPLGPSEARVDAKYVGVYNYTGKSLRGKVWRGGIVRIGPKDSKTGLFPVWYREGLSGALEGWSHGDHLARH
jgi:hypothetical protein